MNDGRRERGKDHDCMTLKQENRFFSNPVLVCILVYTAPES